MKYKSMPFAKEYKEVFSLWWITGLNEKYYTLTYDIAELTEEGIEWLMK